MYRKLNLFFQRFLKKSTIFKYLFNYSPMYRRSCGKIVELTEDLSLVRVRIKLSYKNRNYAGTMFGGSMFSAADPISMIQFVELLNHQYIVWDKSARIKFKKPAREDVWMDFKVSKEELNNVLKQVESEGSFTFTKTIDLTDKDRKVVFASIEKELYVATKEYYKARKKLKMQSAL